MSKLSVHRLGAAELPVRLQAELRAAGELPVRVHPDSRRVRSLAAAIPLAAAATTFGALYALLVPVAPLSLTQPWGWVALLLGGPTLGYLAGSARLTSLRPRAGQGLLVGPASVVIVDHEELQVVPAARLQLSDEGLSADGVWVDRVAPASRGELFEQELAAAIAADADRIAADPWLAAGTQAGPPPHRSYGKRGLVGALVGFAIAAALEFAPVGGAPVAAQWLAVAASVDRQVDVLARHGQRLYEQRLAELTAQLGEVTTVEQLVPVLVDVRGRGLGAAFEQPVHDQLQQAAAAELEAATTTDGVVPLLEVALAGHLDDSLRTAAEHKFTELARQELETDSSVQNFDRYLYVASRLELDQQFYDAVAAQAVAHAEAQLGKLRGHRALLPYWELCLDHELGEQFEARVRERYVAAAIRALPRADADELAELEAVYRRGWLNDELEQPLHARRRSLAFAAMRTASDPAALDLVVRRWWNDADEALRAELEPLIGERALALAATVATAADANSLLPYLPRGEQGTAQLLVRRRELLVAEAEVGGIPAVQAYLAEGSLREHESRAAMEQRLASLCADAFEIPAVATELAPDEVQFMSHLLRELCSRNSTELTFQVALTEVQEVDRTAPELAKAATEVAKAFEVPMEIVAVRRRSGALIELDVTGYAPLGATHYPCRLHIRRLYESPGPDKIELLGECRTTTRWGN